jgi:hypothetical protein
VLSEGDKNRKSKKQLPEVKEELTQKNRKFMKKGIA